MLKTLESPLDCKEIKPVNPKGNPSWVFIGKIDAEAETPILWPSDAKNWLIGKGPDAGKDWRWEEKGMTEDEMVGWHHWLYGYEFKQAPGVGDGPGSLACCYPLEATELTVVENPPANAGDVRDMGSNPGSGRSSGGGHGNPLQYSYLENPTDRETW